MEKKEKERNRKKIEIGEQKQKKGGANKEIEGELLYL